MFEREFLVICFSFQVGSILNGMLDQSFRERTVRKQQGVKLVTAVLRNWEKLDSWWAKGSTPESKMAVLTLLAKVLQVCIALQTPGNFSDAVGIVSCFQEMLLHTNDLYWKKKSWRIPESDYFICKLQKNI